MSTDYADIATRDATMEGVLADLAATVRNHAQARKDHPTYGYTVARIRADASRFEGALALYAVTTGTAMHHGFVDWSLLPDHVRDLAVSVADVLHDLAVQKG